MAVLFGGQETSIISSAEHLVFNGGSLRELAKKYLPHRKQVEETTSQTNSRLLHPLTTLSMFFCEQSTHPARNTAARRRGERGFIKSGYGTELSLAGELHFHNPE